MSLDPVVQMCVQVFQNNYKLADDGCVVNVYFTTSVLHFGKQPDQVVHALLLPLKRF